MSLNVIDLIKGQLGPALVSQAATQYGESESGISKAISGLLPAVVGGMANNANQPALLDAITGSQSTGLLGNLLGRSSNNSLISSVLSAIFGDKINGLINAVSGYSGVSNSTSGSLLNMVAGAALGSLGKYAADHNLDRNSLSGLLSDQKGIVSSLLPAGLSLASLGLGNWGGTPDLATEKVKVTSYDEPKLEVNRGGNTHVNVDRKDDNEAGSIWKWLLPLLLLALAAWFLWKQCNKPAETTTGVTDSTAVVYDSTAVVAVDSTGTTLVATKKSIMVTLPNGKTLNAYEGGIEDQIVAFLNSDEYKNADEAALKDRWFNFDNLNFEFGTTKLTPESQAQLDNLKLILVAYPNAKVKIGAYTDKKGDDAGNKALSQKRADAVKAALGSAQVTSAEGYGEEFATVPETASDKEREADRKTAIRFTK